MAAQCHHGAEMTADGGLLVEVGGVGVEIARLVVDRARVDLIGGLAAPGHGRRRGE